MESHNKMRFAISVKRQRLPRIPAKDRIRIEAALLHGRTIDSVRVREALRSLRELVKTYRALSTAWGQSERRSTRRDVRLRLQRIAAQAEALISALEETKSDEAMLDHLWASIDVQKLLASLGGLRDEALNFKAAGRPFDANLGVYVEGLAHIWEKVHGEWPGRTYNPYLKEESGAFRTFVGYCIELVAPGRSIPDGLIRRVLKGRRIAQGFLMEEKSLDQRTTNKALKSPPA
jgi:hypothetical protein